MAVLPPLPLATFILLAPILYHFSSPPALSVVILYAHSASIIIWLTSIPEIRLLLQTVLGFSSGRALSHSPSEMYGLQHTLYNIDVSPQGYWFNMGLWDEKNMVFADGCRALVHKVIDALGGQDKVRNTRVLDVGFGCGDSCFMMAEEYGCNVVGITIEDSQYEIAQGRLLKLTDTLNSKINLLKGSATDLSKLLNPKDKFDIIVAVDCAYHFDTRWSFLRSSLGHLSHSGQIGLFDVAIQPNAFNHPLKRWLFDKICSGGNIPVQNMVNADEYEAKLQEIGYVDIHIERIDVERVYGGLARFLKQHAANLTEAGLELSFGNYNRLITVAKVLDLLCWGKWIEPVVVTAKKPM
ncbi:hypothetical protein K450DRAFT_216885 [Umbelopsis ramanniana AG]|uniref:phosphoethanolamine N-methyltransferase n=1 Tax=Umbelopsis ramanniana AG TaxID=1314678 RepID=A0AAD5EIM6_UMBRA|nr:uncharacterized protein K450DRAFT_216885 [Umbelopsis ramanniana AG]KAI8584556.1 hypothetical protein K450DRAFT_216885 [Umbelopsis ramanniana AG]